MLSTIVFSVAFFHGLLLLIGMVIYNNQAKIIYKASKPGLTPEKAGLDDVEQLQIKADDGVDIVAWHLKPATGMPTLLYFHGNYCNLSNRKDRIRTFQKDGYGVFMIGFRGYGVTEGLPSEPRNVADAKIAYDWLIESGLKAEEIVIYGESMGAAVATQVAVEKPSAVMILESPFTSLVEMAQRFFPFLPVGNYINDRFETEKHISKVKTPIMIVHSLHDELIPFEFGQKVFAAAGKPKALHVMDNVGHSGLFRAGAWTYIRGFIEEMLPEARKEIKTSVPLEEEVYDVIDSDMPLTPFGDFESPSVH